MTRGLHATAALVACTMAGVGSVAFAFGWPPSPANLAYGATRGAVLGVLFAGATLFGWFQKWQVAALTGAITTLLMVCAWCLLLASV